MASFREVKRRARGQLHTHLAEPALYLAGATAEPVGVTVRLHFSFSESGELLRGGFSNRQEVTPRVIFLGAQVQPAHGGILVTRDLGAWFVDNDLPPDDITVTAEVSRLSSNQVTGFGWDPQAQFMGLAAAAEGVNAGFAPVAVLVTKGDPGQSAYTVWLAQPGNIGKSEQEFIEYLGSGDSATWAEKDW